MVWRRVTLTDQILDDIERGWETSVKCIYGETIRSVHEINYEEHRQSASQHPILISWFTDGKRIMCSHHYYQDYPNARLFALINVKYYGKSVAERKQKIREAFAYADKHGYEEAFRKYKY